jgi:hypothetical protein
VDCSPLLMTIFCVLNSSRAPIFLYRLRFVVSPVILLRTPEYSGVLRALSTVCRLRPDFKNLDKTHSLKVHFIPNLSKY